MNTIIKKLLVISLIFVQIPVYANQAIDLEKDQKAPYSGTLLDKEKANNVKNELLEKDSLAKQNESLNKELNLFKVNQDYMNEKNDLLLKQNIDLTKNLNDTRQMSDWTKVGYFLLGVVVVGAGVYGASRLR